MQCFICTQHTTFRRYGAWACASCAAFFRRFVLEPKKFSCRFAGTCGQSGKTFLILKCKSCRLKACFTAGMLPQKVKGFDPEAVLPEPTSASPSSIPLSFPESTPQETISTNQIFAILLDELISTIISHPSETNRYFSEGDLTLLECATGRFATRSIIGPFPKHIELWTEELAKVDITETEFHLVCQLVAIYMAIFLFNFTNDQIFCPVNPLIINMTKPKVYVVGVGMTKFTKPQSTGQDYPDMVKEAVNTALDDCGLKYTDVQQATAAYLYGGTCNGQRALYEVGMTGIPIYNVNNACASGSSGVFLCKQIIESGNADCVLACGFEKMAPGSLENMGSGPDDGRAISVDKHIEVMGDTFGLFPAPITCQMFTNAALEHMKLYGTKREHFAKIGYKNHLHSVHNEKSQFRKAFTLDEVINARKIYDFCGLLECSPTSDGAAAAIIVSEKFLNSHPHLRKQAVEIVGMEVKTDFPSAFSEKSNIKMIGYDMVEAAAKDLFRKSNLTPNDVQVIEMHDCFAANELISYEAIGLCPKGKAGELIDRGDNTYGGKWVINPSGGLISKGHPIGATGVAQIVELSNQLRGRCGKRQVPNCKVAMQHNIGIGGAIVVGLYRLAGGETATTGPTAMGGGSLKSDIIFQEIKERAKAEKDLVKGINSSFRINVSDGNTSKSWTIDLNQDPPFIGESDKKVDVELTLKDDDFMSMAQGKLKPDQAFMQGKMKLKGNIAKAMKLKTILDPSMIKSKI